MREIVMSMGKDFCSDMWRVAFRNNTGALTIDLQEAFRRTIPYPGIALGEGAIKELIEFLQKTLEEPENEQSNLERLEECDS